MTSKKVRLRKLTGNIRMRSRNQFIRLRDTKLKSMGVYNYPSLLLLPLLLLLIVLLASLRRPDVIKRTYRPIDVGGAAPMTGWAVPAESYGQDDRLDVSLAYAEATWAELEAEKGVYNFEAFEEKNHFAEWWAEGKRIILRVVSDRPGEAGHKDIPEWLVKEMGGELLAGSYYTTAQGSGFSPDYSSIAMRDAHGKLIAALAKRYDEHPGVAYIEIGSLGHDGTWTVEKGGEGVEVLPGSSVSREYAWHYTVNFSRTQMLMRRPYKEAQLLDVGLYNTDLGDEDAAWAYIDVIEAGGYDRQIETDLLAMPDFYQRSPSGAHIPKDIDLNEVLKNDRYSLSRQIMESHLTYAVIAQPVSQLSDEAVSMLHGIGELIGCRVWIRSAQWDTGRRAAMTGKVILRIRNDGIIAPHGNWRLALALFKDGEMVYSQLTELTGGMMQPGEQTFQTDIDLPYGIEPGSYTFAAALVDTLDGQTTLPMTMGEYDSATGWTMLGEMVIAR